MASPNATFNVATVTTLKGGNVIAADITATGNITANNGLNRMARFSRVSATGDVTGRNFLTLGYVNAVQQVRSTLLIANNSITVGSTSLTNSGLTTNGAISAVGAVRGGNLVSLGTVSASGAVSTAGNITGAYILGNGAFLTGISGGGGGGGDYGNANVAAYLPTYTGSLAGNNLQIGTSVLSANSLSVTLDVVAGRTVQGANLVGTLQTASQPNITSIGDLSALRVNGEIQATSMALSGAILAGGPITGTTITGTGLSIGGQAVINGNLNLGSGRISTTGNVTASSFLASGVVSTTGTVTAGGLSTSGAVSAAGTVTGGAFSGNGYNLTNLLRSNQTRTVYIQSTAPAGAVNGDIWYQTY